jgi:hypothetical protein
MFCEWNHGRLPHIARFQHPGKWAARPERWVHLVSADLHDLGLPQALQCQ